MNCKSKSEGSAMLSLRLPLAELGTVKQVSPIDRVKDQEKKGEKTDGVSLDLEKDLFVPKFFGSFATLQSLKVFLVAGANGLVQSVHCRRRHGLHGLHFVQRMQARTVDFAESHIICRDVTDSHHHLKLIVHANDNVTC